MHIKQITIQGFKSYKDQTVIDPFSPKHNVIVGRNGSGKSNFFAAIRFVLNDHFIAMGREERQGLLHEGTGSAVMSAYVEVVFDNEDERFPTNTEEVILRRTIGLKKDEYSVNRKNSTKNEVMNLLESAGFSRSNPYYIVPQGRITAITNMKDPERLNVLKDVAGTQVYDSKRTESVKIMEDSKLRRENIDEILNHIRERLDELEEEKNELREYQDKDRERRCLEHRIYEGQREAAQSALDTLDTNREGDAERTNDRREALKRCEADLERIDREIAGLQQQSRLRTEERSQLEDDRKDTARQKAAIEYDVQSLIEGQTAVQQARTQHANDLQNVQAQIAEREKQLAALLPNYNAKKEEELTLKRQTQEVEATRQRLYAKQGRSARYRNKRERDTDLNTQISDLNTQAGHRRAIVMEVAEEITELEKQINQLETDIASMRDRLNNRGDEQQNISAEVQAAKEEKDASTDERKEVWREEARLDSFISQTQQELDNSERFLATMMDQGTSRALAAVRRIVRDNDIQGAYGSLGDLFEFNDKYKTAVEVTAGTSLFNYVVDTDATATRILNILDREKPGRMTFMPLNRLNPRPITVPKAADAVNLLTKLKFDQKHEKAFQQVFGTTIVCPSLQVASQYARSHGVTAITPDGDRSDKKGAITGGYYDTRRSRIDGMKRVAAAREKKESVATQKQDLQRRREELDQKITKALSDLQKIEQRRMQIEGGYGPLRGELRRKDKDLDSKRDELTRKQKQRDNLDSLIREQRQQISDFEAELASEFKKALTDDEERQLQTVNQQYPVLKEQLSKLRTEGAESEVSKTAIESELRENLRPDLERLQASEDDMDAAGGGSGSSTRVKEHQAELQRVTKALDALIVELEKNEASIDSTQQQLQQAESSRAEKQKEMEELTRSISNLQKSNSKFALKRSIVLKELQDVENNVRTLGVLPDAAFTPQYQNMSTKTANDRLHKVQAALKKYGHVNKKAFEQFAQFERQRDTLEQRRRELDSSDNSITQLIEVLDQRKDEAIERTFRQVSKEFARIFERLVPSGRGRLVIQRRTDPAARAGGEEGDSDDEAPAAAAGNAVENYTGVGISVSFNSKHDEQQRIQQLSGGQKSLCALTLIFAIQASDPAPFYLFDEIDANLDAQYRTAVADLIKESAETGQFICTTFRPEMLRVAAKCYGVSQERKASRIGVVEREEALDFVEGQVGAK